MHSIKSTYLLCFTYLLSDLILGLEDYCMNVLGSGLKNAGFKPIPGTNKACNRTQIIKISFRTLCIIEKSASWMVCFNLKSGLKLAAFLQCAVVVVICCATLLKQFLATVLWNSFLIQCGARITTWSWSRWSLTLMVHLRPFCNMSKLVLNAANYCCKLSPAISTQPSHPLSVYE